MGVGTEVTDGTPDFGAALDVDADCNRVYGKGVSVSPADTLAIFLDKRNLINLN